MSDWNIRQLYEQPPPDLMEAEAFFAAFARFHDIEGHSINCILTKSKRQPLAFYSNSERNGIDGLSMFTSVLLVRESDLAGAEQGASLKIDGTFYKIMSISRPISDIIRMDLEGYAG